MGVKEITGVDTLLWLNLERAKQLYANFNIMFILYFNRVTMFVIGH